MVVETATIHKKRPDLVIPVPTSFLDQLDTQLVCELEVDARLGYLELAEKFNTSPRTVTRRLKRLFNERIIASVTVTDPVVMGYRFRAGFGINARPDKVDAIAQHLGSFRCINHVIITSGRYDVMAWGCFARPEEVVDFVSGKLGGIADIANVETMIFLRFCKDSWTYSGIRHPVLWPDRGGLARVVDDVDILIIKELEGDPRKSVTDIARQLGMSRTPVQRRLKRLLDEKIVRVVAYSRPRSLGFNQMALILVKASPSEILSVAEKASSYGSIGYVSIVSGGFDISMAGVFRNSQEMYRFIADELGAIPGVIRCESMHLARFVKKSYTILP